MVIEGVACEDCASGGVEGGPCGVGCVRRRHGGPATVKEEEEEGGNRCVRIYCDGIFDLFHYGHARAFEQAKKMFPSVHLLVGVCNDESTLANKGKVVMTAAERCESVRHCRWVDEVIPDAPWIISKDFLTLHKIDYVAHDAAPYQSGSIHDVYAHIKASGRFLETQRTAGVSTTDLIGRILGDFDAYVRRNMKGGATARDLHLSPITVMAIRVSIIFGWLREHLYRRLASFLHH